MPILRGKNVLLRPYRRSDLPGILSWTNDTEATRYLTEIFDQPYTEKNGEDFLTLRAFRRQRAHDVRHG